MDKRSYTISLQAVTHSSFWGLMTHLALGWIKVPEESCLHLQPSTHPHGGQLHSIPEEPRAHGEVSSLSAPPPLSMQSWVAWGLCRTSVLPMLSRGRLHHQQEHHGSWLLPPTSEGHELRAQACLLMWRLHMILCWKASINDKPVFQIHTLL